LFTHETRAKYDLESLWGVGAEFEIHEDNCASDDLLLLEDMISRQNDYLADIQPLQDKTTVHNISHQKYVPLA
jgi:hypothetical protein